MSIIFHVAAQNDFFHAKQVGYYSHPSLEKEGFIHCSRHYQLQEVADLLFKGREDLVLLAIDQTRLVAPIRYEGPSWNTFPHIYGKINLNSIVQTFDFVETSRGFELPQEALDLVVHQLSQISVGPLYKDSRHYDAMNGETGSDVDFYVRQAKAVNGRVLDLACGTGRFSLAIAQQGLSVTGLDLSGTMLTLAKEKAKRKGLQAEFGLGDMRLFNLNRQFDFIFCGFNSSQHLHEEKEYRSFLESVKKHLAPQGVFAFDIFNPSIAMLNRKSTERFFVSDYLDPQDQKEIQVWEYPTYDEALQLSSFRFVYEKEGHVLFEEHFSLRNYFPLEIDVLLRNCGFEIINKFGTYKEEPFSSEKMKQIFICKVD